MKCITNILYISIKNLQYHLNQNVQPKEDFISNIFNIKYINYITSRKENVLRVEFKCGIRITMTFGVLRDGKTGGQTYP